MGWDDLFKIVGHDLSETKLTRKGLQFAVSYRLLMMVTCFAILITILNENAFRDQVRDKDKKHDAAFVEFGDRMKRQDSTLQGILLLNHFGTLSLPKNKK
jgi:hypothetical protein